MFHQQVHSISPEQSPAEKQRGLHVKVGKRRLMNGKKKSLSKPRRWHGFHEKEEVCWESTYWSQSLPLLKAVSRAAGWCWESAHWIALRQRGARCPQGPEHVHPRCQGSGAGRLGEACWSWLQAPLVLSLASWAVQVKR